jgi:hypothetical protein
VFAVSTATTPQLRAPASLSNIYPFELGPTFYVEPSFYRLPAASAMNLATSAG